MKIFVPALLLLASFLAHANGELIKLMDGTKALCETRSDFALHNLSGVYRPLSIEKKGTSAVLHLEILRCVEQNESYGFVLDKSFEKRSVQTVFGPKVRLLMERMAPSLVVMNGEGTLIDRKELTKNQDGTYSVEINFLSARYDEIPHGRKSFEINIQSLFKLTNEETGEVIDEGIETLGSYRFIVK